MIQNEIKVRRGNYDGSIILNNMSYPAIISFGERKDIIFCVN